MAGMKKSGDFKDYWNKRAKSWESLQRDYNEGLAHGHTIPVSSSVAEYETEKFLQWVDFQKDDVVLDAGCGVGGLIEQYHHDVKKFYGIDFSKEMLRIAQEKLRNAENVILKVADVQKLPFDENSFDKTICIGVLQHLSDDEYKAAIKELARVTRKDGFLILHIKNGISPFGIILKMLRRLGLIANHRGYYRPFYKYKQRLKEIGQIVAEYSVDIVPLPYPEFIYKAIRTLEVIISKRFGFLRPFGKEYFFKVKVLKVAVPKNER